MTNIPSKKCKTLTEQWREGKLPTGSYYIRIITGNEKSDYFEGKKFCFWSDYEVEEVLAPVPSYDNVKEMSQKIERLEFDNEALEISRDGLEKKLDIAVKALKEVIVASDSYRFCQSIGYKNLAQEALKEIEEVK